MIEHGYEVAAVVVAQSDLGKSRRERQLEVAKVAEKHNIRLLTPDNLRAAGTQAQLAAYGTQAAVLIAYGQLVPPAVLQLFPVGIINLHPSLLPLHRGPTPLESVILEGAPATGVSLMRLDVSMDTGPVYVQEEIPLSGRETKQALADQLGTLGTDMLLQALPAILDGSLDPEPQDDTIEATYDLQITKADGQLDWSKPATRLEREIRAYAGWPRSRTTLNTRIGPTDVIITQAHVATAAEISQATAKAANSSPVNPSGKAKPGTLWRPNPKQLGIYTADDVLIIDSLVPAGKKIMSAAAFLAGYRL